jgi:hypothetical protein
VRRATALQEMDDLEHAMADAQRVRTRQHAVSVAKATLDAASTRCCCCALMPLVCSAGEIIAGP